MATVMTDIQKALRAAAHEVCEERNHPHYPNRRGDIDANIARAAVLAFLREMPDWMTLPDVPTLPQPTVPTRMIAAIEEVRE